MKQTCIQETDGKETLAVYNEPIYQAVFFIDPRKAADKQEYRVWRESYHVDTPAAFRNGFQHIIYYGLKELGNSIGYERLAGLLGEAQNHGVRANRFALHIQVFSSRMNFSALQAEVKGLFFKLSTFIPDSGGYRTPVALSELNPDYRLKLCLGAAWGRSKEILDETNDQPATAQPLLLRESAGHDRVSEQQKQPQKDLRKVRSGIEYDSNESGIDNIGVDSVSSVTDVPSQFTFSSLLPPKGASYEVQAQYLAKLSHEFRKHVAAQLELALNLHIQAMPHETLDQKKELARWVKDQLEPLGLAVQEPKTGRPGKLRGVRGNWPGVGCFQIEVNIDGRQETPTISDELPTLQLMDVAPPEEVKAHFRELVKKKLNRTPPARS